MRKSKAGSLIVFSLLTCVAQNLSFAGGNRYAEVSQTALKGAYMRVLQTYKVNTDWEVDLLLLNVEKPSLLSRISDTLTNSDNTYVYLNVHPADPKKPQCRNCSHDLSLNFHDGLGGEKTYQFESISIGKYLYFGQKFAQIYAGTSGISLSDLDFVESAANFASVQRP